MKTEGVKYAGSKNKLVPLILEMIKPLGVTTVLDGFAGTTRVSQALKKAGYAVISNDIAVWSRVFGQCYLLNRKPSSHYAPIVEHLNHLPGKSGWFTRHYGGEAGGGSAVQTDGKKRIWQKHNTRKLDAIREEIDRITSDEIERAVLLTSLILAMDKVDSSLGHQVSYLKKWSARSYKTMKMRVPAFIRDDRRHRVFSRNIFDLVEEARADLAYYDPPYGSANELMPPSRVRYASYYHLWKTIVLNDRPQLTGAANRRSDASDTRAGSVFEDFRRASSGRYVVVEAIEGLLKKTKSRHILLSYSNGGRATLGELTEIIRSLDFKTTVAEIDYRPNVMSRMKWTEEWTGTNGNCREYLFLLKRDG
ncbi:MAG: DNA adenine methylase [Pyrinomonadaceae bacterium]